MIARSYCGGDCQRSLREAGVERRSEVTYDLADVTIPGKKLSVSFIPSHETAGGVGGAYLAVNGMFAGFVEGGNWW